MYATNCLAAQGAAIFPRRTNAQHDFWLVEKPKEEKITAGYNANSDGVDFDPIPDSRESAAPLTFMIFTEEVSMELLS